MASPSGISIDVAPKVAGEVSGGAELTACWAGSCHAREVRLRPSTTSTDTTCADGACSARTVPTGGVSGFAKFQDLPSNPVRVTLTLSSERGEQVVEETLKVIPETTYPNGRDCGAGGSQAGLMVGPSGSVRVA